MEKEYIQVSFENGNIERKSYPAGIRLLDLAKEYQKEDDIVLAKVNGRLRELYLQLTEDCRISFITTRQQEGMAAYRYDAAFAEGTLPSGRACTHPQSWDPFFRQQRILLYGRR